MSNINNNPRDSNSGFRRLNDNNAAFYTVNNQNKAKGVNSAEIEWSQSRNLPRTLASSSKQNPIEYSKVLPAVFNNSFTSKVNYGSDNSFLSVKEEPCVVYDQCYEKYIQICSNDRDISVYPSTSEFKINFEKIKNVTEVELVSVILPNQNNVLDEPYLLLEITELPSNIEFSANNIQNAFAILPLKKPNKDTASFIIPELGQNYRTPLKLKTPLASIQSFTISLKDMSGAVFQFGTDSDPPIKNLQTTFVFKIKRLEKDFSDVQTRAVY